MFYDESWKSVFVVKRSSSQCLCWSLDNAILPLLLQMVSPLQCPTHKHPHVCLPLDDGFSRHGFLHCCACRFFQISSSFSSMQYAYWLFHYYVVSFTSHLLLSFMYNRTSWSVVGTAAWKRAYTEVAENVQELGEIQQRRQGKLSCGLSAKKHLKIKSRRADKFYRWISRTVCMDFSTKFGISSNTRHKMAHFAH